MVNMGVDANAGAARRVILGDTAGGWRKLVGILGIDAAFDGMTLSIHVSLANVQFFSCSDTNLRLHQINSGDRFSHGMFHLQTRIHFNEIKLVFLKQKLKCADATITKYGGMRPRSGCPSCRAIGEECRARALPREFSGGGAAWNIPVPPGEIALRCSSAST